MKLEFNSPKMFYTKNCIRKVYYQVHSIAFVITFRASKLILYNFLPLNI